MAHHSDGRTRWHVHHLRWGNPRNGKNLNMTPVELFLHESNLIEDEIRPEALEDAIEAWKLMAGFKFLTVEHICAVHKVLMYRVFPEIAGKLRTVNVRVGSRSCPPWDAVPRLLDSWLLNHSRARLPDNIVAAHVAFEKVHPFQDGNGRMGRLIMLWQRMEAKLPVEIIKADERTNYYKLFH